MNLQKEIKELGKSKIQQWRTIIDEMEVQLALGKVEIKDMLNKEKQNLSAYIEKQDELFREEEKLVREEQVELKSQLEDLYMLVREDLPQSKRSFDRVKKENLRKIHELEFKLKKNSQKFHSWIGSSVDELKEALDEYRIALALSSLSDQEGYEEAKEELKEELQSSRDKIMKELYPQEKRINHFIHEISTGLEHLKKAFIDVLD